VKVLSFAADERDEAVVLKKSIMPCTTKCMFAHDLFMIDDFDDSITR
jgi:hypothetical protein